MIEDFPVACADCDWRGRRSDSVPIDNLYERVEPGDPFPAGQCPQCGALVEQADCDHKPDWSTIEHARGYGENGGTVVFKIHCAKCGAQGAIEMDRDAPYW